ncbi:MAG: tetratricopeptide repeat protein [Candidatus Manganitrophaceae bacterium]
MQIKKIGTLFVFLIAFSALTACYGKAVVSKIPHFNSPSGWPNDVAAAKNNEGVAHLLQSHWDASAPFFKEAIVLSPNFPEPYFNLGVALDGMGKKDEAKEAFTNARKFGSDDPRIVGSELLKKYLAT